MGTIVAVVAIIAGSCFLAGLALSDWGTGNRKLAQVFKDQQVQLSEEDREICHRLFESIELEWQQRLQNGQ